MDVSTLFANKSVVEIREIENKTRLDIEKKKEELQLMVGERYRELIEAADTITDMKENSSNVLKSISRMQGLCSNLKNLQPPTHRSSQKLAATKIDPTGELRNVVYETAAMIKLLLGMPEKVWLCIEQQNFAHAALLFLASVRINSLLQSDPRYSHHTAKLFPIVSRHWTVISHFKQTILTASNNLIQEPLLSIEKTANCLCAIVLLEAHSSVDVLQQFLEARKSAVESVLKADDLSLSVKEQICHASLVVHSTAKCLRKVFTISPESECDLLMSTVQSYLTKSSLMLVMSEFEDSLPWKHLPISLGEFSPSQLQSFSGVGEDFIRDSMHCWIESCKVIFEENVPPLLNLIESVSGLTSIRDDLWSLLKEQDSPPSWMEVCQSVLGRPFNIWSELLQQLLKSRIEVLIRSSLSDIISVTESAVSGYLQSMSRGNAELDVHDFIWQEDAAADADAAPAPAPAPSPSTASAAVTMAGSLGWGRHGSERQLTLLQLKAKAITPQIAKKCEQFDGALERLHQDVSTFLGPTGLAPSDMNPFDKVALSASLAELLRTEAAHLVTRLLGFLAVQSVEMQKKLGNCDSESLGVELGRVMALCRLAYALRSICPHLPLLVASPKQRRTGRTKQMGGPWAELQIKFVDLTDETFRVWCRHSSSWLVADFYKMLEGEKREQLLTTNWEEIEIMEEGEDGQKVKSSIFVPCQASLTVLQTLCRASSLLSRSGSHAFTSLCPAEFVRPLASGMFEAYAKSLAKHSRQQPEALQMMFNVRFLVSFLVAGSSTDSHKAGLPTSPSKAVLGSIEKLIDPFDLDVFLPHIKKSVQRQVHRSQVLYGALLENRLSSKAITNNQKEQHNVLTLSTCNTRFQLLPIATKKVSESSPLQHTSHAIGSRKNSEKSDLFAKNVPATSFLGSLWFSKQ